MTATVMSSRLSSPCNRPMFARRASHYTPEYIFTAEVEDFDGETHTYEVMAETESQAASRAESLAWGDGITAYHINIYK